MEFEGKVIYLGLRDYTSKKDGATCFLIKVLMGTDSIELGLPLALAVKHKDNFKPMQMLDCKFRYNPKYEKLQLIDIK